MKKIGIIISIIMLLSQSYATTICAANDTVALVLDPTIYVTDSGYNTTGVGIWWAQFDFGRIHGIAAMLNRTCNGGQSVSQLADTDNNGVTKRVVGGERYGNVCWCRMTHPALSKWVCGRHGLGAQSYENCLQYCGYLLRTDYAYRDPKKAAALFGSIE